MNIEKTIRIDVDLVGSLKSALMQREFTASTRNEEEEEDIDCQITTVELVEEKNGGVVFSILLKMEYDPQDDDAICEAMLDQLLSEGVELEVEQVYVP